MRGFVRDFFNLLKYEFLSSIKPLVITYALGIISLAAMFSCDNFREDNLLCHILVLVCITSFSAFGVILIVRIFQTFWREIFGAQGYLTLTLPVSLDAILLSKILIYTLWAVATLIFGVYTLDFLDKSAEATDLLFTLGIPTIIVQTLYAICLILFVTSLLNALKVRSFVLVKGFFLALIIQILLGILLEHALGIVLIALSLEGLSIVWILNMIFAVVFYLGTRFLIIYKLELE